MAYTAAYTGLRWGELVALTICQVDQAARVITVDRKVVEVAGHLFLEAPKNRKHRRTAVGALLISGLGYCCGDACECPGLRVRGVGDVCQGLGATEVSEMRDRDGQGV